MKFVLLPPGPEFGGEKNCVYIGMVTEDLDVSELVETIAATGREIEENSRVCIEIETFILFFIYWFQSTFWKKMTLNQYT